MDWQLPDIGKTITNNILPSSLSAYVYVSGVTVILSIGSSRLNLCISVSCCVIPMDTHWFVCSRKIRFNSMNHVGHVLNDYFNGDEYAKLLRKTRGLLVVVQT